MNDVPAPIAPARNLAESPSAKETRKTAAVARIARPSKPRFGRLATDCSDEILDFNDEIATAEKATPVSSFGKRKKSDSPPKPVEEPKAPRPYKRLVGTCDAPPRDRSRTRLAIEVCSPEEPDGGNRSDSGRLKEGA